MGDNMKKIVLCILDGVGLSNKKEGNALKEANMTNLRYLKDNYPHSVLDASGEAVGIPEGQMGNSEVGHLNIGAGRIVYQDLLRIDESIKTETFFSNEAFLNAIENCKKNNSNLHIIGMTSDGGVHSQIRHLYALLELCKRQDFNRVYIHALLDGRDTKPLVAKEFIDELKEKLDLYGFGEIITIMGRYYAMNRDRNWELTEISYKAIFDGIGVNNVSNTDEAFEYMHNEQLTDEFMKPTVIKNIPINDNDSLIAFNYRSDRMIQMTRAIKNKEFNEFERRYVDLYYATMTEYENEEYTKDIKVAFPKLKVKNSLGSYISNLGLKQLRLSEFEKRLHVTYYFSGGNDKPLKGEDQIILERPDVFTYDEYPSMRSDDITTEVIRNIDNYDLIIVNYPNGDALGHTGIYDKVIEGLQSLDKNLGRIINETNLEDYILIVTADHGNCEEMFEEDGTPNKKHTTNKVPFIIASNEYKLKNGKLCDIAPTILDIMGIEKPSDMTGESLIIK